VGPRRQGSLAELARRGWRWGLVGFAGGDAQAEAPVPHGCDRIGERQELGVVTATGKIKACEAGTPPPPVLILTTYDNDADILAAVEAGASGYMLKDAPPEQIRQAVVSAAAGQTALAPEVAARLMGRIRNPVHALSAREVQLVELLATGMSNRAMAKQLFISEATVKTHLVHIYGKLGVDNRTAAIAAATQRRIIRSQ
jgi:DNA-binding NarL/FixJ family response regulator